MSESLVQAELLGIEHTHDGEHDATMTTRVRFDGCLGEDVRRAFFAAGFYEDPPVLRGMTCTREELHGSGPGARFEIDGFRPLAFRAFPMFGNAFEFEWRGDAVGGSMIGPLWEAHWRTTFHDSHDPPHTVMTEQFEVRGCPGQRSILGRTAAALGAVPGVGALVRSAAARACVGFHERFAPYHETLPPRIARYA